MSRPPKFDDQALIEAVGPRAPAGLTREDRVRLLGEAAKALLEGKLPEPAARVFLAAGISAWLREGGSLTKHFWKVDPERGSHATAATIWARHRDEGELPADPLASSRPVPGENER